jgi:hypothetical protein
MLGSCVDGQRIASHKIHNFSFLVTVNLLHIVLTINLCTDHVLNFSDIKSKVSHHNNVCNC